MRHRFKSFVWVALLAICGVALGPSVSRALDSSETGSGSSAAQAHSMEMGAHAEMTADAESEDDSDCHGHSSCPLDCCALCAVAALPLMSAAIVVPKWLPLERAPHSQSVRSSLKLGRPQRWSTAVPRGPPSVS